MKRLMLGLLVLCLILISTNVHADQVSMFSWTAPTTNEDGSILDDLAGYNIYCGTLSGTYDTVVDVGNVTTYLMLDVLTGPSGTYYCVATVYDTSNNESQYSNEIVRYKGINFYDGVPPSTFILETQ